MGGFFRNFGRNSEAIAHGHPFHPKSQVNTSPTMTSLLIPAYSDTLPKDVQVTTQFTRNIALKTPVVSSAMDTVTESAMAIAMAQEGGIGVLHKNMSTERQAMEVRKVKRAESGMIQDPVTLSKDATVEDANRLMTEYRIGGIPIINASKQLIGIVTNRDLRFESNTQKADCRCDDE